jgi:hypothetical protein
MMTGSSVQDEEREALRRRLRDKIKGKRNKEEGPQLVKRMMDDPTTMMLSLGIEDPDILNRAKSIVKNPKGALQNILGQNASDILPKARRRRKQNKKARSSRAEAPNNDASDEEAPPLMIMEDETNCTIITQKYTENTYMESDDEEAPPP